MMACQRWPELIANVAGRAGAGISALTGKRAFRAGSAAVAAAGAVLLAARQRRSGRKAATRPALNSRPHLASLAARPRIRPRSPAANDRCAGCGASGGSKKGGPWYTIAGKSCCQDCALPLAAQEGVELVVPASIPPIAPAMAIAPATATKATTGIATSAASPARPGRREYTSSDFLPADRRVSCRLLPSKIRVDAGRGGDGRTAWAMIENGRVLLRPDGSDTGLAVVPGLTAAANGQLVENRATWWLVHIASGKFLGRQYASFEEARLLGEILAQLDWNGPEQDLGYRQFRLAENTIRLFDRSLVEAAAAKKDSEPPPAQTEPPKTGSKETKKESGLPKADSESPQEAAVGLPKAAVGPSKATTRMVIPDEGKLTGQLVAEPNAGLARVVADNGDTLLVVDDLGTRYEVFRDQIRQPDQADFEACHVAQPFSPPPGTTKRCRRCGQAAASAGAGESWYTLGWKTFCPTCAEEQAVREGYSFAEDICLAGD